jgi:hypothetical protein
MIENRSADVRDLCQYEEQISEAKFYVYRAWITLDCFHQKVVSQIHWRIASSGCHYTVKTLKLPSYVILKRFQ